MKVLLHHINIVSDDARRSERFYHDVMGLGDDDPTKLPVQDKTKGYTGDVAFVTDGSIQFI